MSINDASYYEGILARHEETIKGKDISRMDRKIAALERRFEISLRVVATLLAKEKRRGAKMLAKALKAAEPSIRKNDEMRDLKGKLKIISGIKAQRHNLSQPETLPEDMLYMTIATMIGLRSVLSGKQKSKNEKNILGLVEISQKRGFAPTIEEILFLVSCIPLETRNEFSKETSKIIRGIGFVR